MNKVGKLAIFCLIILFSFPFVFGMNVETKIPNQAVYNEEFEVIITILPENETKLDLVAILPEQWVVTNWTTDADAFFEIKEVEFMGETVSASRWTFENVNEEITLSYKTKAATVGENQITTLWVFPSGFDSESYNISVKTEQQTQKMWAYLLLLLLATAILILGLIYREYLKLKKNKTKHKRRKR